MARQTRTRREEVRELLAGKGIRVTKQRLAILEEMSKLRRPCSHAELTERLAKVGLDRATVYRNLLSLTEAGLLVKTQLDAVWRFELPRSGASDHDAHPHFVCNDCGDISCLPKGAVTLRGEARRAAEVQLRGQCGECAAR